MSVMQSLEKLYGHARRRGKDVVVMTIRADDVERLAEEITPIMRGRFGEQLQPFQLVGDIRDGKMAFRGRPLMVGRMTAAMTRGPGAPKL